MICCGILSEHLFLVNVISESTLTEKITRVEESNVKIEGELEPTKDSIGSSTNQVSQPVEAEVRLFFLGFCYFLPLIIQFLITIFIDFHVTRALWADQLIVHKF